MATFRFAATLRRMAWCAPILLLTACASVPISTMWKMRDFGPADIAALDPETLRVATLLDPVRLRVDPAKATLLMTLVPRAGGADEVYTMQLREALVGNDDLVPRDAIGWQILRLTPESAAMMREALPRVTRDMKADYTRFSFKVAFGLTDSDTLAGEDEMRVTVRLALAADQEAFTLLDRATIPITHDTPSD